MDAHQGASRHKQHDELKCLFVAASSDQVFREWTIERNDLLTDRPQKAPRRSAVATGSALTLQGLPLGLQGALYPVFS